MADVPATQGIDMGQSRDNPDQNVDEIIASIRRIMDFDGATGADPMSAEPQHAPLTPSGPRPEQSSEPTVPQTPPSAPAQPEAIPPSHQPAAVEHERPMDAAPPFIPPASLPQAAQLETPEAAPHPQPSPPTVSSPEATAPEQPLERGSAFDTDFPLPEIAVSAEAPADETANVVDFDDDAGIIELEAPSSAATPESDTDSPCATDQMSQPLIPDAVPLEASGEEMLAARMGLSETSSRSLSDALAEGNPVSEPVTLDEHERPMSDEPADTPDDFDSAMGALVRPMIREWIDDNMPRIVEKVAREELSKKDD